ncbi:MAG: PASTA domain-containing protein, partial [Bifidobacteriaceae bacterium]|nr:PASTA domain-containing protein [Bifidobacteriaceae bacterium]
SLVPVPALTGRPQAEAEAALTAAGLSANVTAEFSDDVPAGDIIDAGAEAGQRVEPGTIVKLVVSRGVRQATVPDEGMIGQLAAHARGVLAEAGLDGKVTERPVYHTTVAAGVVLDVEPAGGAEVDHNRAITLVVSRGPEPVEAPTLTGLTLADAEAQAEPLELTLAVTEQYSEEVAEGLIISQLPAAGAGTHRGAEVSVVVSLGMPFVEVPNVFWMNVEDAIAKLAEFGLKADKTAPLGELLHLVQSQDPPAGESVRKGSTVTLTVV